MRNNYIENLIDIENFNKFQLTDVINIHDFIAKYSTFDIIEAIRSYQDNIYKTNELFMYLFVNYYIPINEHDGFSTLNQTNSFLSTILSEKIINIIDTNTYDNDNIDGIKILNQLGLNNKYNEKIN